MSVDQSPVEQGVLVPGEGPEDARLVLVGEQPGDQEDRVGRPFVGPAGKLLDAVLADIGLAREDVYLTNVVKRFHYRMRGKRRIHQKPSKADIAADLPLLMAELERIGPDALVLLGATAAQAVVGPQVRITRDHGMALDSDLAGYVTATAHPAAVLRSPDRRAARQQLLGDLELVAERVSLRG